MNDAPAPPGPAAVVLLSGGLDSAVTAAIARRDGRSILTLAFDYGQRHRHELAAARRLAVALGAHRHVELPIDLRAIGGSALTADIPVPKDRPADSLAAGIPITYVPARNLIFLSIATGLAEVAGASEVWLGVNAVDYSGYPDCRAPFLHAFETAANLATRAGSDARDRGAPPPLRVVAPLVNLAKHEIIAAGAALGVPFHLTHSCYDPSPAPASLACGRCDSCRIRARGFADAGVPDPTPYAPAPAPPAAPLTATSPP